MKCTDTSIGDLLQPLDEAIENHLLPAIMGTNNITQPERNLYSLPIRLGGLGIPILTDTAELEFSTSVQITAPLAAIMILQGTNLPDPDEVKKTALEVKKIRDNIEKQKEEIVSHQPEIDRFTDDAQNLMHTSSDVRLSTQVCHFFSYYCSKFSIFFF